MPLQATAQVTTCMSLRFCDPADDHGRRLAQHDEHEHEHEHEHHEHEHHHEHDHGVLTPCQRLYAGHA